MRGLAILVAVHALAPGGAQAQRAATDPRESVAMPPGPANVGLGARIGGGLAYANGVPDASVIRLDYEAFLYIAPRNSVGGLFGFLYGIDYWHARDKIPDNWGVGMPAAAVIGMRAVALRGLVGLGVNAFTVDQVDDDTGFGWCAPLALANVGLDIHGITAMFDARVSRRWQIGSPDHTQWMLSLMIGVTMDPRHNPRFFDSSPVNK